MIEVGDRVLLVDDLMAAGHSKLRFIRTLQSAGAEIAAVFVLFNSATFSTDRLLAPLGVGVRSPATWHDVLRVAR